MIMDQYQRVKNLLHEKEKVRSTNHHMHMHNKTKERKMERYEINLLALFLLLRLLLFCSSRGCMHVDVCLSVCVCLYALL